MSTLVTLLLTGHEIGLNERGQIAERLAKADDQLGSTEIYVRYAGIHTLESIARDFTDDRSVVVDRLASFIRIQTPISSCDDQVRDPGRDPIVEAAILALSRLNNGPDRIDRIDLSSTCLRGIFMADLNLHDVNLANTDLSYVRLGNADLSGANLTGANLANANIIASNLTDTLLCSVSLTSASFDSWTNLTDAAIERRDYNTPALEDARLINPKFCPNPEI